MKTFIEISKMVRSEYKKELPFIAVMCKLPQREDVMHRIDEYLSLKNEMSDSVNRFLKTSNTV